MPKHLSNYRGSPQTAEMVKKEIALRWGEEEAENRYDPLTNCLPFSKWRDLGRRVKKGEKSIRSITFIEKKDEAGNVIKRYRKTVHLFYYLSLSPE